MSILWRDRNCWQTIWINWRQGRREREGSLSEPKVEERLEKHRSEAEKRRPSSLSGTDWLVSASRCQLHRLLQGAGGGGGWEERGKPLSCLSLSLISGSSGARFPRVPHFRISYLGPRFKYRSFIFLHVICMQLIKPGSHCFRVFLLLWRCTRRQASTMLLEALRLHLNLVSLKSIWAECQRNAVRESSGGKESVFVWESVSDFYPPSFSSLYFWRIHTLTSLFGTVSTPLLPPGRGRKPFPVEIEWEAEGEKRER